MVVDPNDRTPYQPQVRILKRASDPVQPDVKSNKYGQKYYYFLNIK